MVEKKCLANNIFQTMVDCLLSSWQYSEITDTQQIYNDRAVNSDSWKHTKWIQSADFINVNEAFGKVEVCYTKDKPELDEGPFLSEERNLIDAIRILLGGFLQKQKVVYPPGFNFYWSTCSYL